MLTPWGQHLCTRAVVWKQAGPPSALTRLHLLTPTPVQQVAHLGVLDSRHAVQGLADGSKLQALQQLLGEVQGALPPPLALQALLEMASQQQEAVRRYASSLHASCQADLGGAVWPGHSKSIQIATPSLPIIVELPSELQAQQCICWPVLQACHVLADGCITLQLSDNCNTSPACSAGGPGAASGTWLRLQATRKLLLSCSQPCNRAWACCAAEPVQSWLLHSPRQQPHSSLRWLPLARLHRSA